MRTVNLPTDLLRTFITVIEVKSHTRAADLLNRSQPAISLQIKRLEDLVGYKLIRQKGRTMHVSEKGEALAMHARQILRLNDLAMGLFERHDADTDLRIGLPLDYGVRLLQREVTDLLHENDALRLTVRCDLSHSLHDALLRDELDIIVALYQDGDPQFLVQHWREQPVWVGAETIRPGDFDDLPLVAHPPGCVYRQRMTDALRSVERSWKVVFSSPDIDAVQQAVRDGMGFTGLTIPTTQRGMRQISPGEGLPPLEPLRIGLFYRQTRLGSWGNLVAERLTAAIENVLQNDADPGSSHNNLQSNHISHKFPMVPDSDYPDGNRSGTVATTAKQGVKKTRKQRSMTDGEID
ncbi:LysR family transcriptional regulator [uncultured Roseobacter sp.]|uniref:LysR family transcriptional regulator n=1 Tax=uncultured Roseobacter sp. TaxID=114847 RepID=UPI0026298529|nr:LysR family transcriptional regulator [uncultured Roseobacter sp.]